MLSPGPTVISVADSSRNTSQLEKESVVKVVVNSSAVMLSKVSITSVSPSAV